MKQESKLLKSLKAFVDYTLEKLLYPIIIAGAIGGCNHWHSIKNSDTLAEHEKQINELKADQ